MTDRPAGERIHDFQEVDQGLTFRLGNGRLRAAVKDLRISVRAGNRQSQKEDQHQQGRLKRRKTGWPV